ncbi:class I SAM-dependent methyltransferase [Hymenobacter cheonanensis]|uniref:class I SAM-dependent methyltransferase n=1 Tax=Hymenobacter sp. CA2-7 TaxID=3063993 RepID=UPI002712658E|nr:methyltransferase domain-containing protein [Hymenobacter sp. CA2-7]MDO7884197.1 methyltransferase domain-containing protein [Hymenobacter sp. CA2-7]
MDSALTHIRDQQQQTWDAFSPGWKNWDSWTMAFLRPMGTKIIEALHLRPTDQVLDIATGTGEPGLTIARLASQGSVVGLDLSAGMLATARENAARQGLTNYTTLAGDACALPFASDCFDAISCRMGFMFFPDMLLAAQEMYRVLKPGGRLATSVWAAPPHNPWITTMMGALSAHLSLPAPVPQAPGMFRCAQPGLLAGLLETAGFQNVREEEVQGSVQFDGPDGYWQNMTEVAAPVVAAMSRADGATRADIKANLFAKLAPLTVDGRIALPFASLVLAGEKP